MELPEGVRRLLWDVDPDALGPEHRQFVIERILEFGDVAECEWMFATFGRDEVVRVLRRTRRLSPKSANFWRLWLRVPPEEVPSLQVEGWI